MRIVGGFDVHWRQITFDYLDERSSQCRRGRITPADRMLLRGWLTTTLDGAPAALTPGQEMIGRSPVCHWGGAVLWSM
jgi:hypothetical protein